METPVSEYKAKMSIAGEIINNGDSDTLVFVLPCTVSMRMCFTKFKNG